MKTRDITRRFVCIILVISMLLQNSIDTVWAKPGKSDAGTVTTEQVVSETDETDAGAVTEAEIVSEITGNRSLFAKEYLLSDNSKTVVVYTDQIHYETEDGVLAEIDNSLVETQGGYTNGANSFDAVFSDSGESQGQVLYKEDGYEIVWQMVEVTDEGTSDGTDEEGASGEDVTDGDGVADEEGTGDGEDATDGTGATDATDGTDAIDGDDVTAGGSAQGLFVQTYGRDDEAGNDVTRDSSNKNNDKSNNKNKDKNKDNKNDKNNRSGKKIHKPAVTARVKDKSARKNQAMDGKIFVPKQSAITYAGYAEGVTVEYEPTGDGIKENIILPDKASGNEYVFSIRLKGLEARITESNEVEFYDEETGEVKYYFPAPFMVDQTGEISYEAYYELADLKEAEGAGEGEIYLKILLDEEWLSQASYPVTVDPVLKQFRTANILDQVCVVSNNTYSSALRVGKDSTGNYRTYHRFKLPAVPAQSIISEALLYLDGESLEEDTFYIEARMVEAPWQYKDAAEDEKLTWNNQPDADVVLDYTTQRGYLNITKAVNAWYSNPGSNYGLRLQAYDEDKKEKRSGSLRYEKSTPYLKITYRTATGLESYWGYHATAAGTAGAGSINDYTGALTVVNTDVVTAGNRFPMSIGHVYNSNGPKGPGWHLNYEETIKVPVDRTIISTYPYVYTDSDGTEHYFKKEDVTYLLNGQETTVEATASLPPAKDEDGLNLYIVPVTDTDLKADYPLKLVDKSSGTVKYFDTFGRLGMITDSNRYERVTNATTNEQNHVIIHYVSTGDVLSLETFTKALEAATTFQTVCKDTTKPIEGEDYINALNDAEKKLVALKQDPYVQADYKTATHVRDAATALSNLTDISSAPSRATAKEQSAAMVTALTSAQTRAAKLTASSNMRIGSIEDAVGNEAHFTYNTDGRVASITDPTYEMVEDEDGTWRPGANTYSYDVSGNLTQITFANGKSAYYTYDTEGYLTAMQDTDGYQVTYTLNSENKRVEKVSESHETGEGTDTITVSGQTYGITYNQDNSTTFRFSGVDDVYETGDDIENVHVFDEKGRTLCIYSKPVGENKILGATAVTYQTETDTNNVRNKIKDSAVVGMHSRNYLLNHSFEYNDTTWTLYKNESDTPETGALNKYATTRKYMGGRGGYVNMAKRTGGVAGFKQDAALSAGTYTLSGYVSAVSVNNTDAYLKVKTAEGSVYTSNKVSKATPAEFDNGWERLDVTFTISSAQTVTVYLETDTGTKTGAGTVVFDCIQLEEGEVANDYNILEDGSFELTEGVLPYKWRKPTDTTIQVADEKVAGGVDGDCCYHITGEPGKSKFLRFTTNLGSAKNSYVLSGWIKSDTTPVRSGRSFQVKAYHSEEDAVDEDLIEYTATCKFNTYSEGWKYFCLIIPAETWKSTDLTIGFSYNIGDLYIDGLQLTRNDVQTKGYNSDGKLTSRYTAIRSTSYSYDAYHRMKTQTSPSGEKLTYNYAGNNNITSVASSIGPENYYTYDIYGNRLTNITKDADATTNTQVRYYTENTYTDNGNFLQTSTDVAGNTTVYEYNELTGQLEKTLLPLRLDSEGETINPGQALPSDDLLAGFTAYNGVTVDYLYDSKDRIIGITQTDSGDEEADSRSVTYTYGEFDDLTAIGHNGFSYGFTYDKFGNVLTTSIAGQVTGTNEYADYNGSLLRTTLADGTVLENTYDVYGRITANKVGGEVTNSYVFDNDGNLYQLTDKVAGLTTRYDYNDSDMVVRSAVYAGENTDTSNLESRMQYTYTKGGLVGGLSYAEGDGGVKTYTYTYANDALPTKSVHPDGSTMAWSYDVLRRNTQTIFTPKSGAAAGKKLYTTMAYQTATQTISGTERTTATPLVSTYTNKFGSTGTAVSKYTYTYDNWGNIISITDLAGKSRTYSYNDFSEIESATENYNNGTSATYAYTYDAGGNILTETINGATHTYSYDSVWKDKLVSYDGQAITYDQEGHPLSYLGSSMTWDVHNRLSSISGATPNGTASNITYTYLSDGSRRSKTVDGVTTTYHYNNGLLLSQTTGDETIRFYYDSTGKVVSIGYQKGTAAEVGYFFARNAQGDIIAVYRSSDSKLIGTYEYDLWGKPVSTTEASAGIDTDGILSKNPLRYRGYYFDEESGFYYLQSRYYDPGVRRFISADSVIASVGTSVEGYNLFGYCFNNPINRCDESGCWPKLSEVFSAVAIAATVTAVVSSAVSAVAIAVTPVTVAGGGCVGGGASLAVASAASSISNISLVVAGTASVAAVATSAVENTIEKRKRQSHTVYVLKDENQKIQYVGRTVNPDKRKAAHAANPAKAKLTFVPMAEGLTYEQARIVEQALITYHHTLKKSEKDQGYINNQINGIGPKYWGLYKGIAQDLIDEGWDRCTNEILYWIGS